MTISFIVVALNAASTLPLLLEDLKAQTFPLSDIELILVDSGSTDGTRKIMEEAGDTLKCTTLILENPKKWLASGCNIALKAASGDAVIRLDAHARIPSDFLEKLAADLEEGKEIVGGCVLSTPPKTAREAVLTALDASRFCGGAAPFRNKGIPRYVDALAYALYRREVYTRTGFYDERLQRTEDNDMHYRMKKAGFRFFLDPRICSYHSARGSLSGQLAQKWGNGLWIGRTLSVQPACFSFRHLVPALFVLILLFSLFLFPFHSFPLYILLDAYLLLDLLAAAQAARDSPCGKIPVLLLTPLLFPLVHICYGIATLAGLASPVKGTPDAVD